MSCPTQTGRIPINATGLSSALERLGRPKILTTRNDNLHTTLLKHTSSLSQRSVLEALT